MKNAIRTILLLLVLSGIFYWYATQDNKLQSINNDITKNDIIARDAQLVIDKATKQKEKAEKIKQASLAYIKAISEANEDTTSTEKQALNDNTEQPQAPSITDKPRTKTNIACLEWSTLNISEWYWEDYVKIDDCWAFADYWIKWCYQWANHTPCLLNNDISELNKLIGL